MSMSEQEVLAALDSINSQIEYSRAELESLIDLRDAYLEQAEGWGSRTDDEIACSDCHADIHDDGNPCPYCGHNN